MLLDLKLPSIVSDTASGDRIGFSNFSLNLMHALEAQGVEWSESADIALYLGPPHLMPECSTQMLIAYSMWETEPLPRDVIGHLSRADVLIVPSQYCKAIFRRAGLRQPIYVVPLGIHPEDWPSAPRVKRGNDPLRFLWVNASSERKGWTFLAQAWSQAFTPQDRVTLTIKTSANPDGQTMPNLRTAQVRMISQRYAWEQLRDLYCVHHVFLCTSACEGFGLTPLEAMACGLLVISPRHTGLAEFISKATAWVCETERVTMRYEAEPDLRIRALAPKVSHLKTLLRQAVDGFDATYDLRVHAQQHAKTMTWERSGAQLLSVLERYAGRLVA